MVLFFTSEGDPSSTNSWKILLHSLVTSLLSVHCLCLRDSQSKKNFRFSSERWWQRKFRNLSRRSGQEITLCNCTNDCCSWSMIINKIQWRMRKGLLWGISKINTKEHLRSIFFQEVLRKRELELSPRHVSGVVCLVYFYSLATSRRIVRIFLLLFDFKPRWQQMGPLTTLAAWINFLSSKISPWQLPSSNTYQKTTSNLEDPRCSTTR